MDPITAAIVAIASSKAVPDKHSSERTVTTVTGQVYRAKSDDQDRTIRTERSGDGLVYETTTRGFFSDKKSAEWIPQHQIRSDKTSDL